MKRYLVFAGNAYYPDGGWQDYHSEHETELAAMDTAAIALSGSNGFEWAHVVDSEARKMVLELYTRGSTIVRQKLAADGSFSTEPETRS